MYTVEEIKNKVKTGTWTKEDVARCVEELKQISDFTVYTEEIYYISYGIFAYNFREYAYPLIEICREAGVHMERSKEKSRLYLALVRLYFCLGFPPKIVEYGKMPMQVRKRYEVMEENPEQREKAQMLIRNFDKALLHPDDADIQNAVAFAREAWKKAESCTDM